MTPTRISAVCAGVVMLLAATTSLAQPVADPSVTGIITILRGNLYSAEVGTAVTVFLVTPEGIILADPLDRAAAAWLKDQLAERFPDRPVRYVIHTSHRFDRSEGASAFTESAEIVAHRAFDEGVRDGRSQLDAELTSLDSNRSGTLDGTELDPAMLRLRDRNGDGRVTPGELYTFVRSPESTYVDRRTITLGGRRVEVVHPGPAFGHGSTAILFPAERVVFVDRQPDMTGALFAGASRPRDVTRWARTIATLDAETVITPQGGMTDHSDLVGLVRYLDDLFREVVAAAEAGRSTAEVVASPVLNAHRGAPYDAERPLNVAAMRRSISIVRIGVHGTGAVNAVGSGDEFCSQPFTVCERPQLLTGAIAGLTVSRGRMVVVAELTVMNQSIQWRTSPIIDDALAHRETTGSFLGGYTSPPARRLSFSALGGFSYVVSAGAGLTRRRFAYERPGGLRPYTTRTSAMGYTGGVDVSLRLTDKLGIVVPVRITRASVDNSASWAGPLFLQGGVGLRYRLYRNAQ